MSQNLRLKNLKTNGTKEGKLPVILAFLYLFLHPNVNEIECYDRPLSPLYPPPAHEELRHTTALSKVATIYPLKALPAALIVQF